MIRFELILYKYPIQVGFIFKFLICGCQVVRNPFVERIFFLYWIDFSFVKNQITLFEWVISGFCILSHWSIGLSHCLHQTVLIVSLKSGQGQGDFSNLKKNWLFSCFVFPYSLELTCLCLQIISLGFNWDSFNAIDQFGGWLTYLLCWLFQSINVVCVYLVILYFFLLNWDIFDI